VVDVTIVVLTKNEEKNITEQSKELNKISKQIERLARQVSRKFEPLISISIAQL
jgi:glycosyltransferase involved in cell wall biosynthesis